ncbi:MAG: sigma-70 family RNA polymerase sigma factor [Bacteroidales bacterium]|nr:sigma-70 family RNA polymerase sigma factor [Bacteroidales bacterium]
MIAEDKIIDGCKAGKRRAQNILYKKYAPTMLGICMRYTKNQAEAEDVLQESFIKIFTNIKNFRKKGSFEGWIKKIMINTALNNYKKNLKHYHHTDIEEIENNFFIDDNEENNINEEISPEVLIKVIQNLPQGYKMILNLFVFERHSHKEIAQMLNISVNTSKSQLLKARRLLKKKLVQINNKSIKEPEYQTL